MENGNSVDFKMQGYLEKEKALSFCQEKVGQIFTTFLQYKFHSLFFLNSPCPINNYISEKTGHTRKLIKNSTHS